MNKKIVYTCICGDYDSLVKQKYVAEDYTYVCFTDNPDYLKKGKVFNWIIRPLVFDKLDATRNNRWHKLHPHLLFPDCEISIYIDANINILSPYLFEKIETTDKDLLIHKHYDRDCVFDEAQKIKSLHKDSDENIDKMLAFLEQEKMPRHYGLTENNILCRKNTPLCRKIMEEWWYFVLNYTKRDQMSLMYVLWKNGLKATDVYWEGDRKNKYRSQNHVTYIPNNMKIFNFVKQKEYDIFYLLRVPVFKIRYKPNKKYVYLLGVKVLSISPKKVMLFGMIPLYYKIFK